MNRRARLFALVVLSSGLHGFNLFPLPVQAQTYPAKPVKFIVGFPPGGSGDAVTRLMADEMSKQLGVQVLADNRPGAGATIASDIVAKSPADGYTVLIATNHAVNKALYKRLPFDPDKDFAAVTGLATGPQIICVHLDLPVKSLKDLITYAKANPGKLFAASSGNGSGPHMSTAQFEAAAGAKFTTVQFKGGGPAALSLMAGETQVMFATAPTVMGFIQGGRMRALAVTTRRASPAVPGLPGAEEAGVSGYDSFFSYGMYVPTGTPMAVIRRLHAEAVKVLSTPDMRKRLAAQGMDPTPSASPEAFDAQVRAEAPILERVIRLSGAQLE